MAPYREEVYDVLHRVSVKQLRNGGQVLETIRHYRGACYEYEGLCFTCFQITAATSCCQITKEL
jgi:hypothetical protein